MAVLQLAGEGIGTGWHWLIQNIIIFNILLSVLIIFFQRRDPKSRFSESCFTCFSARICGKARCSGLKRWRIG